MPSFLRYLLQIAAALLFVGSAFVPSASAQTPPQATDAFIADPDGALKQFPNGGPRLVSLIRDAVVSHPEAFQKIVDLMKTANKEQQSAFGSGFGQAAQIAVRSNQSYADRIQQSVATSGSEEANTAFAAVTGNVLIGSAGGGAGGGGGGAGGPTSNTGFAFGGTNSGTGGAPGPFHYQTASQPLTVGAGVPTASDSVSPR